MMTGYSSDTFHCVMCLYFIIVYYYSIILLLLGVDGMNICCAGGQTMPLLNSAVRLLFILLCALFENQYCRPYCYCC